MNSKKDKFSQKLSLIKIEDCRPEVLEFARFMELVLRENDHKGTWKNCSFFYLLQKLDEEVAELHNCFWFPGSDLFGYDNDIHPRFPALGPGSVFRESADVANIAMMIFDNLKKEYGGLP